jgi:hypothetical protein
MLYHLQPGERAADAVARAEGIPARNVHVITVAHRDSNTYDVEWREVRQVNVELPVDLAAAVADAARQRGTTKQAVVEQALRQEVAA